MLVPITTNVFEAASFVVAPGGIHFPLRMVVLRLADGSLLLHSPIKIDDALATEIENLGPVRFIMAPNLMHHIHLGAAARRYPEATVLVAPGLEKKRSKLPEHQLLTDDMADPFGGEVQWLGVDGVPDLNEIVLLHTPSKTLVTCDLLFNMYEAQNWWSQMVFRMAGAWQKPAQSRLIRSVTKDRAAAGASVRAILDWDFDRVTMSHGEIVEDRPKDTLAEAVKWMAAG